MTINKLAVYCEDIYACMYITIYPPIKQFSFNPTNELFILDVTDYAGSYNDIFSIDGNTYWTTNCNSCWTYIYSWTLYWGSYMNQTSNLLLKLRSSKKSNLISNKL